MSGGGVGDHAGRLVCDEQEVLFVKDGDHVARGGCGAAAGLVRRLFRNACLSVRRVIQRKREDVPRMHSRVHPDGLPVDAEAFRAVLDAADLMHGKMQFLAEKLLDGPSVEIRADHKIKLMRHCFANSRRTSFRNIRQIMIPTI